MFFPFFSKEMMPFYKTNVDSIPLQSVRLNYTFWVQY